MRQVGMFVGDFLVGLLFRVYYIPKVSIERLGNFVEVTFKNPNWGLQEGSSGWAHTRTHTYTYM